jgi:hypothetical protein
LERIAAGDGSWPARHRAYDDYHHSIDVNLPADIDPFPLSSYAEPLRSFRRLPFKFLDDGVRGLRLNSLSVRSPSATMT